MGANHTFENIGIIEGWDMTSCSDTELLLRNGLSTCGKLYEQEMNGFYPRKGYIDESNLVRLYIEALKKDAARDPAITHPTVFAWTEYLNGHRQRLDAVIKINDDIVFLEAKRIKHGSWNGKNKSVIATNSIGKDSVRLFDPSFYKKMEADLRKRQVFSGDIYRVLIAAFWPYTESSLNHHMNEAKKEWLNRKAFPSHSWKDAYTNEEPNIYTAQSKKSDLSLLIAIAN